jgi:hypothetical protein
VTLDRAERHSRSVGYFVMGQIVEEREVHDALGFGL